MIDSMEQLASYLAEAQRIRAADLRCELSPALSARVNDAALIDALFTGLPMAQGIQHRILRSRGSGIRLTAKIRYRQGVRIRDGTALTPLESAGLETARGIVAPFLGIKDEEARFQHVYDWVCRNISYVHTAPGHKGYERLVGAACVLQGRQANCQGFADVLYLLCGLCGIECKYHCGMGERRLHLWNAVRLNGSWREADASKGARGIIY